MNKGVKIVLNVLFGAGLATGGYFLGRKHGKAAKEEWARKEINDILDDFALYKNTHDNNDEVVVAEKPADPKVITPDILDNQSLTEWDEGDISTDVPEPEEIEEVVVPVKPKKPAKKKLPRFIGADDLNDTYDVVELSIDRDGDIYVDESDDLYTQVELLGDKNVKSLRAEVSTKIGDGDWYIVNDNISTYYHIVQK